MAVITIGPLTTLFASWIDNVGIPYAIATIAGLAFVTYCIYQYFFSPLAGIPGPFIARLGIISWPFVRGLKCDTAWALKEQHDRHGNIVRLGRNLVSISDPEAISTIYKSGKWVLRCVLSTRHNRLTSRFVISKYDKGGFYERFRTRDDDNLSAYGAAYT
jgi:hypothetical protein